MTNNNKTYESRLMHILAWGEAMRNCKVPESYKSVWIDSFGKYSVSPEELKSAVRQSIEKDEPFNAARLLSIVLQNRRSAAEVWRPAPADTRSEEERERDLAEIHRMTLAAFPALQQAANTAKSWGEEP